MVETVRRGVLGLLLVVILATVAVVLRDQLGQPGQSTAPTVVRPPVPAPRVVTSGLPWREVPVPVGLAPGTQPAADLDRQVFQLDGNGNSNSNSGGVRRLVVAPGATVVELPAGVVRTRLQRQHLLVQRETSPGVTELSTVDLVTGRPRIAPDRLSSDAMAVTESFVVVPMDERCLAAFEPVTLARRATHCADAGWSFSLLTAEPDGAQWRATASGEPCARWFRLDSAGAVQPLRPGDGACRAAVLVRAGEWELTADFPPYEVGASHPGPLVARHPERQLTLDASALDAQVCGGHVYWLGRLRGPEHRGELTRWAPGAAHVETLPVGEQLDAASPPRCVNGVLNVVTTVAEVTRLWLLAAP